jgi:hypothetical protein
MEKQIVNRIVEDSEEVIPESLFSLIKTDIEMRENLKIIDENSVD